MLRSKNGKYETESQIKAARRTAQKLGDIGTKLMIGSLATYVGNKILYQVTNIEAFNHIARTAGVSTGVGVFMAGGAGGELAILDDLYVEDETETEW